jgi:hypothetical protein
MGLDDLYDADSGDGNRSYLQHPYQTQLQQNQEQRGGYSYQDNDQFTPVNAPEEDSSMILNGAPPDLIYYRQVMGTSSSCIPLNNQQAMGFQPNPNFPSYALPVPEQLDGQSDRPILFPPNPNLPYAPSTSSQLGAQQPSPTKDEILDAPFGVQIGLTRFPTLGLAIRAAASLIPADPGFLAIHGRNAASWNHSMVNHYPYYDDGPRIIGQESRLEWATRIFNARNQMGIIRRQEPLGMDFQRAAETVPESRRRRDRAKRKAELEDAKHKRKIDPTSWEYDAKYAAIWRAQQSGIANHNARQRVIGLQNRRAFDVQYVRPWGPDPQLPDDEGNDLYDFVWHRQQYRKPESGITTVPVPIPAKFTRCIRCKNGSKGCDLGVTEIPCTRCRARNHVCEGCDTPEVRRRPPKKKNTTSEPRGTRPTERQSIEVSTSGSLDDLAWPIAQGYTIDPGLVFQDTASELLRREEASLETRSASPQRGALFSDRCDNCQRYGKICEDTRPCFECMDRNLVCNGSYMDNPYRSPSTNEGSDGSENARGSFDQVFGGYRDCDMSGEMNDPDDPALPEPWNWYGSSNQQYQEELENVLDLAGHQWQPTQQNLDDSQSTAMEAYCDYSLYSSLAHHTEHRRFVNRGNGSGSRPKMAAFRVRRVLENVTRASNGYNEPAGNSMTLTFRSRSPQASQNTAEEGFPTDQATVDRELALLEQVANNASEADPERLAQVAAAVVEAAGIEDHQPWSFVQPSGNLATHEALPPRMLLNYDGSGNPTGPERVNLSSYPLFSDDTWCYVDGKRDYETDTAADFHTANVCNEWVNHFGANISNYMRQNCRNHFSKECQTIMDHHDTWHTCRTCHKLQDEQYELFQALLTEGSKAYLCVECATKLRRQQIGTRDMCECIGQMKKLWLCHAHRQDGLQRIDATINQINEFMIRVESRNLCVGCNKNEGDRNSGAWGCKSCRTWVSQELFAQEGHLTM